MATPSPRLPPYSPGASGKANKRFRDRQACAAATERPIVRHPSPAAAEAASQWPSSGEPLWSRAIELGPACRTARCLPNTSPGETSRSTGGRLVTGVERGCVENTNTAALRVAVFVGGSLLLVVLKRLINRLPDDFDNTRIADGPEDMGILVSGRLDRLGGEVRPVRNLGAWLEALINVDAQ